MEEEPVNEESSADMLLTPLKLLSWLFNRILGQIAVTIIHLEIQQLWSIDWAFAFPHDDYANDDFDTDEDIEEASVTQDDTEHNEALDQEYKRRGASDKMNARPCDKELYLYDLEEEGFSSRDHLEGILRHCSNNNCER